MSVHFHFCCDSISSCLVVRVCLVLSVRDKQIYFSGAGIWCDDEICFYWVISIWKWFLKFFKNELQPDGLLIRSLHLHIRGNVQEIVYRWNLILIICMRHQWWMKSRGIFLRQLYTVYPRTDSLMVVKLVKRKSHEKQENFWFTWRHSRKIIFYLIFGSDASPTGHTLHSSVICHRSLLYIFRIFCTKSS